VVVVVVVHQGNGSVHPFPGLSIEIGGVRAQDPCEGCKKLPGLGAKGPDSGGGPCARDSHPIHLIGAQGEEGARTPANSGQPISLGAPHSRHIPGQDRPTTFPQTLVASVHPRGGAKGFSLQPGGGRGAMSPWWPRRDCAPNPLVPLVR